MFIKEIQMKNTFQIIIFLLLGSSVYSTIPPYQVINEVIYERKAGMALSYDVLIPEENANGAGIIHIVSAGWKSQYLPLDSVQTFYAPLLEKGYTVYILRHGSAPWFKVNEMVKDVQKGVSHIKQSALEYKVDPERLGIYGGSAGGQLALMTGTMHEESPVAAVVSFFPPTDLRTIPGFARKMYTAIDLDSAELAAVSPITYVSPNDAPTLLVHGGMDFVVPLRMSENMYDTLETNSVPSRMVIINGMFHGGMFGGKGKHFEKTTAEMLNWFDTYLLPSGGVDTLSAEK
jgi:dipeptidyl aminopeptidase/acylaminoacyl peptidase